MRWAVPQHDARRHAQFGQECRLEASKVQPARVGMAVQRQVDQRGRDELHCLESLAGVARGQQRIELRLGQRLAGRVVPGMGAQDLGHRQPVLQHLAGKLHEVAQHRGAALRRVARHPQQPVQRMAEFVE